MEHQQPDWECKYGFSEIIQNKLYLVGEDDIDELLYGEEEARNLNGKGTFNQQPTPMIDVWIDLRDIRSSNRKVFIPNGVEHIQIPFRDGVLEEAREHLPKAKEILKQKLEENKRIVVGCHQGRSRSAMLLIWLFAEEQKNFLDAYWDIKSKRPIVEPDKNFKPLLEEWKTQYPASMGNTFK